MAVKDIKDILTQVGPQAVMALMAAKSAGPQGYSAFMRGLEESRARKQQLTRQTMLDGRAGELHQANLDNIRADNTRQTARLEMEKARGVTSELDRSIRSVAANPDIEDPIAAENALLQRMSSANVAAGFEPDRSTALIPNMAPLVHKGAKADARALLDGLAASGRRYGQKFDDQITVTWAGISPRLRQALVALGHPDGKDVKPSQIEQVFGYVLPAPVSPHARPRSDFDEFFEQEYLPAEIERRTTEGVADELTATERRDLRLKAREAWNRSGALGSAAGRPRQPARTGLTPTQRLSVLRDRAYSHIVNNEKFDPKLIAELTSAGLDPIAEEQRARQKYNTALAAAERSLRPVQGRYGEPEDPAAVEERRERAREMLRGRSGGPAPSQGRAAAPSAGQTITTAEVRAIAQKMGITEQQAREEYRKRKFLIVE